MPVPWPPNMRPRRSPNCEISPLRRPRTRYGFWRNSASAAPAEWRSRKSVAGASCPSRSRYRYDQALASSATCRKSVAGASCPSRSPACRCDPGSHEFKLRTRKSVAGACADRSRYRYDRALAGRLRAASRWLGHLADDRYPCVRTLASSAAGRRLRRLANEPGDSDGRALAAAHRQNHARP